MQEKVQKKDYLPWVGDGEAENKGKASQISF